MITENFDNYKTGGSHKEFNIEIVGTDTVIGNANMLQESITLDEALCSDNNLKFGACEASQFSVQVANIFDDFVDKELIVSVTMDGITTKYGTFKVDSDKPTADRVWRVLTCYDKMKDIINANVLEWYKGLTFPMSQKAYRDSFFTYLGIEQVEVSLINDDFMVRGGFTATDTLSGKTIITSICEFNGVFGHINRDGKFDYVSIDKASVNAPSDETYPSNETYPSTVNSEFEADFECPPYENNSVTYEDYNTDYITRVTMRGAASDVGTSVGVDGNEYIITNNPIIYGTEGTDELITALTRLLNKIGSISYRPYSVGKTIGNPCVELGDAITVNTRHQTINSYVIKRTLTGIQALRDKYSATGSKVYPVEVNSVREEISRTQGKMNILTRTVDETKSQIVAIQTDLTNNYLTSTQTQTLVDQSASQIQATVTQTITAELPDLVDEVTGGLSDRITVVESNYTQLSNEIVMKVKADGTVAQVALGSSAENGSNVLIKGDNIQLDGDVTITSGFKLTADNINVTNLSSISANLGTITAGIIQSANYVAGTSGTKLDLTNGNLETTDAVLRGTVRAYNGIQLYSTYSKALWDFTKFTWSSGDTWDFSINIPIYGTSNTVRVISCNAQQPYNKPMADAGFMFYTNGGNWISQKDISKAPITITTQAVTNGGRYDAIIAGRSTDGSSWNMGIIDNKIYFGRYASTQTANAFTASVAIDLVNGYVSKANTANTASSVAWGNVTGKPTFDTANTASTVVMRDANKYIRAQFYNQASGVENINSYSGPLIAFFSTDGWLRKTSIANAKTALGFGSYLPLSGGSMTGNLVTSGYLQTAFLHASYISRVDTSDSGYVNFVNYSNSAYTPIRTGGYTNMSCKHTKTNIREISEEDALKLLNIKVVDFDYKENFGGQKNNVGVLAEDVYKLLPKVVSMPEEYIEDEFDEEKGIAQPLPSVDYSKFTPYLIKMIQIQQKEIDNLKNLLNKFL